MNQVLIVVGGEGFNAETTETFVVGESSNWSIHSHPGFGSEDMNLATVENVVYSVLGKMKDKTFGYVFTKLTLTY